MPVGHLVRFPSPHARPIISVGRDTALLAARQNAMDGSGMQMQSLNPEQAVAFVRQAVPRLWIFCGSVEAATLIHLAGAIRRYSPGSRLLLMEGADPGAPERALFHRVIGGSTAPESLVSAVRDLVQAA